MVVKIIKKSLNIIPKTLENPKVFYYISNLTKYVEVLNQRCIGEYITVNPLTIVKALGLINRNINILNILTYFPQKAWVLDHFFGYIFIHIIVQSFLDVKYSHF